MKISEYKDLFEDEVAEILRELPDDSCIKCSPFSYFKKLGALYEDGLVQSTNGQYYNKYCGRESYGYIHRNQLISVLSHSTFSVVIR